MPNTRQVKIQFEVGDVTQTFLFMLVFYLLNYTNVFKRGAHFQTGLSFARSPTRCPSREPCTVPLFTHRVVLLPGVTGLVSNAKCGARGASCAGEAAGEPGQERKARSRLSCLPRLLLLPADAIPSCCACCLNGEH